MAYRESYAGKINRKLNKKLHVVEVASGRQKADLVLKNATYVNVFCNELSHGDIAVAEGLIAGMGEHYEGAVEIDMGGKLVLPGFVDAHIHLESALVSPKEFANAVIPHGTTTVITDPHEIANVMGTDGIEYMLQATEDLPVDVRFMLPSCVPATPLDESGAVLDYRAIDSFYEHNRVEGLAEMMNYVGVANADEQVLEKIVAAQAHHKKIDGHAPGLSGNDLNAYIAAGVYSDHECSTVEDAIAKLERGQYIMIREGTAARNLDALLPLLTPQYYTYCMFCTDDKHPNDLLEKGYIPVVSSLGCDAEGNVYNINADTMAAHISGAMGAECLISMTDIAGIMEDPDDPSSLVPFADINDAVDLFRRGIIKGGMIPKVESCIEALLCGVKKVFILDGRIPHSILLEMLTDEGSGTMMVGEKK